MKEETTLKRAPAHVQAKKAPHTVLRSIGLILLAMLLAVLGAGTTLYLELQGNIVQHDLDTLLDEDTRPQKFTPPDDQDTGTALNLLLLGSDTREGDADVDGSGASGKIDGMRSDTAMLIHISADRTRVDVVSIPRDTLLNIPSCTLPNGRSTYPERDAMFNSAFYRGGMSGSVAAAAACSVRTVEKLTDIYIDGYIVINFASFQDVVNTLGGIDMCLTESLRDSRAGLDLSAGCQTLNGTQALALARARYQVGDGSDISRIGRQQELVKKIIEEALALNAFSDMNTFYQLLQDVTKNLETSDGVGDLRWLGGLLYSLRNIEGGNINFITMPFVPEGDRVRPAASARQVWRALEFDRPVDSDFLHRPGSDAIIEPGTPEQRAEFRSSIGLSVKLAQVG
ncbi:MAG: LCP family protein [Trueperella sp.]|nr:LCP family protein [Trueperella sp.]